MKKIDFFAAFIALSFIACNTGVPEQKELSAAEIRIRDSVSKTDQRRVTDSLKKQNPLLIMPPDSQYTGDYIDKYPDGITKFKGFYRFGQRHGIWMAFYPNGLKWSEMHYDKGLRDGPNITYFPDGKLRYEGFYKNDLQDSIWIYYDSLGVVAEKVLYKNNRVIKRLPIK